MTAPGQRIGIKVRSAIFSVAFQQDENNVVGGSLDKTVRIWGIDGKQIGRPIKVGSTVRSIATSKDGRWIVCGGDGGLATICDRSTHEKVIEVKGHVFSVIAVDISPNSEVFATGSHDETAIIWDISARQSLVGPLKHNGQVSGVKFSPDGDRLATATQDDSSIHIFDSRSGELLIHIPDSVRSIHSTPITWSNDGRRIFSVYCGKIKQLDVSTGSLFSIWTAHGEHDFASISLAPNGKFIAYSTAKPGLVSLWDTSAHVQLGPVIEYSGEVRSIALSPDGNWLAAGQYDNKITLWDLTDIIPHSFVDVPVSPQNSLDETIGVSDVDGEESRSRKRDSPRTSNHAAAQIPLCLARNDSQLRKMLNDAEKLEMQRQVVMKLQQTIRAVVEQVVRDSPRVLIDTTSGVLHDKTKQRDSFEGSETYRELVASATHVDQDHIQRTVAEYYKYAMLSHKWDGAEPLLQTVENISVYDLPPSLTHDKLRMFCFRVREAKLRWAWSDTCCIDKKDIAVLQESLVSMFKWYQASTLTIVYLRGAGSRNGGLVDSPWNTRAWTYQEYVAANVVQFYAEDWTPYCNMPIFDDDDRVINHKALPEIVQEMSQAIRNQVGDKVWPELRPGLDHIREKLCLASTRQTTFVEDAAYSLFGILSTSIPIMYGEREKALGRFLAQVLMSSRDVSILAWTGESSTYNSCLPAHIAVFKELATSYLPSPYDDADMQRIVRRLRTPRRKADMAAAMSLYDRLNGLPRPSFTGRCLHLPCITFPLKPVSQAHMYDLSIYHAAALGNVEIMTREDLSRMKLILVYPWISALLDHVDEDEVEARLTHKQTRAFRLIARLRQPFGALLLARRSNGVEYTRIGADSKIIVQIQEDVDLVLLSKDVRTLEVL